MVDGISTNQRDLLNGKWIGNWGKRENVIVTIKTSGLNIVGSYEIDNHSIKFSGCIEIKNNHLFIKFNPPMEAESGGKLDTNTHNLYLYCTSSSGYFKKIN